MNEDYAIWQHDDYDIDDVNEVGERERRRAQEQGSNRDRGVFITPQQGSPRTRQVKKETAVSAARQVASVPQPTQTPDYDGLVAGNMERERLGMEIVQNENQGGETTARPSREFGPGYDTFPDELMTGIDVLRW
jgi:hypothetical protein